MISGPWKNVSKNERNPGTLRSWLDVNAQCVYQSETKTTFGKTHWKLYIAHEKRYVWKFIFKNRFFHQQHKVGSIGTLASKALSDRKSSLAAKGCLQWELIQQSLVCQSNVHLNLLGHASVFGDTDTPVLDFCWCLIWVSKPFNSL